MPEPKFRDATRAAQNLQRIGSRMPSDISVLLPTLLAGSADPDSALNLFERLSAEASPDLFQLFAVHRSLLHYAITVFANSHYLGETLIQNQDLFSRLADSKFLERTFEAEDYKNQLQQFVARHPSNDAAALLARFKRREYVRIMLRDLLGLASLAEITSEISALGDVLIAHALAESRRASDAGKGQFAILSLGKLGGNELNYNSDVDLLYLFRETEARPGQREDFIRLAQRVTEVLSRMTSEGAVFRIDLRLRPQGREGEPAIALEHALRYYASTAHDWELQALIKARHTAGDAALAADFLHGVESRVYRSGLNFAAIETALASAGRIQSRRYRRRTMPRTQEVIDVKLDRGGIRDIEFLVQCLQRVYGGEEAWLRAGGTLFSLQKLHDKRYISGKDFHELSQAYEFLRRLEHRLQLRHGQQTHNLPAAQADLEILARSLSESDANPAQLVQCARSHMQRVREIYERLVHAHESVRDRAQAQREFRLAPPLSAEEARDGSYEQLLQRLSLDSETLYRIAARRDLSARSRRLLHRFLSSALTTSERYASVLRSAAAVEEALTIFELSDFFSNILVRHPDEIATVERVADTAPAVPSLRLELEPSLSTYAGSEFSFAIESDSAYGEKLALIRRQYRHRTFALGISDLLAPRPVFDSLAVTSYLAECAIATALAIASQQSNGAKSLGGFAVLGLGRIGSSEFDFGSDADLLFVRDENSDPAAARRIAENFVEILAAYTQEGTVFAVDTRLRPMGGEGELVITPAAVRSYFDLGGEAQAWEAISFTKLRPVAGSVALARRAIVAARAHAERFAASSGFPQKLLAMRERLAESEPQANFKTARGGFYDIDFITGYLLVRRHLPFEGGNTRRRLHALALQGALSDEDCATLDYAAELMRAVEHAIRLFFGRASAVLPEVQHGRQVVEQLSARLLGRESLDCAQELARIMPQVRKIFEQLVC
jgi:glutamate-ammonia-ligase adenylyltransferase